MNANVEQIERKEVQQKTSEVLKSNTWDDSGKTIEWQKKRDG
jgi:hypothetical protein